MKRKKAALYNPYLDTMGGGERHILAIMKAIEDAGYEIHIFWDNDLNNVISSKLNLEFTSPIHYHDNIFKNSSVIEKLQTLSNYDLFFYVTDGSYFFSTAKKNYVFCMVPNKDLYKLNTFSKLKTHNYSFIANSEFTKSWLKKWNINAEVIYPSLDNHFINLDPSTLKKENTILSVGRFFGHLHSKKHDVIIKAFKQLHINPKFSHLKLVLAGSLKNEDKNYFQSLVELIGDDKSIELKANLPHSKLLQLYKDAKYYWHFAGYGVNESRHPEQVEHLGITPLEAMASGCITFCYKAGGPKEIIQNAQNGFLFQDDNELFQKMQEIITNEELQQSIKNNAVKFVHEHFRFDVLKKRVWEVLELKEEFVSVKNI